ncbi:hypothetical protein [Pseudomonas sp.]|mgnify:CR=1 FL=1|uniref:hypothetical protein n=1 Tax=Pseudomonas sp. TaxID=306 RepID=UPI003FD7825C
MKVICTLQNASLEISGVKFEVLEDGRLVSEEIEDETAELFASVPGYSIVTDDDLPGPELTAAQKKAAEKQAKADKAAADKIADDAAKQKVIDDQVAADQAAADLAAAEKAKTDGVF